MGVSMSTSTIDFRMISVDDHIDLPYLPGDLWSTRLPAHLRDRGPRVVLDGDGVGTWVCGDANWGRWAGGKRDNIKRSYTHRARAGRARQRG